MFYMSSLRNHFLIATPRIQDNYFSGSVIYIFEHDAEGASGLIINQALDVTLSHLFDEITNEYDMPLHFGGPVNPEQGFVLHSNDNDQQWENTLILNDDVAITASRDIIDSMAISQGPEHAIVALGYAGWDANQLEEEMLDNAWISVPASSMVLFKTASEERFQQAMLPLGVDVNLLMPESGHA